MVSTNKHSWIPIDIFVTYSPIVRLGLVIALMGALVRVVGYLSLLSWGLSPWEFHGCITLSLSKFSYDSIRPYIIGSRPSAGVP